LPTNPQTTQPKTTRPKPAREKIIDAANALFYSEGIRAVSVDAIALKAGITKKTLYYHFTSKDDLIAEYLTARDQPNLKQFEKWFDNCEGSVADKTEAIFQQLSKSAKHPKWKGCGFLRTTAELANMPGHPAIKIGANHKKQFERWLSDKFSDAKCLHPEALSRQIVLLMDGAFSTMLLHRDPAYAEEAGRAAKALVAMEIQA
jgi:AcrR family transcriptional regulator